MSNLLDKNYETEVKNVISQPIPFRKRLRNRLGIWWLPLTTLAVLVGGAASMVLSGGALGLVGAFNTFIGTGWNYIIGGAIAIGIDKAFIFKNRKKYAKRENAIARKQKKINRLQRKFNLQKKNYLNHAKRAKEMSLHNSQNNPDSKFIKFSAKEYAKSRRKIDKVQRRMAVLARRMESEVTGQRYGFRSKLASVVTEPLGIVTRRTRGLAPTIDRFNDVALNFDEKKKDKKSISGRSRYDANLVEIKRRLHHSQVFLEDSATSIEALDSEMYKKDGKQYKPGGNVAVKTVNWLRRRSANPLDYIKKNAINKMPFNEKVYEAMVEAKRKGTQYVPPKEDISAKPTSEGLNTFKTNSNYKSASKIVDDILNENKKKSETKSTNNKDNKAKDKQSDKDGPDKTL